MRVVSRVAVTTVVCVVIAVSASAQPIQWTVAEGGNGHFYEAVEVQSGCTWDQAVGHISGSAWSGGHLVTLTSAEENLWVWDTLGQPVLYWLGGVQPPGSPEPGGGWTWVSGEPWSYENWDDGEPNDANGNE